jgi:repressor LexA
MTKTDRGPQILNYIRWFQSEHGLTPTIREIAQGCGFASTSNVTYWLNALELTGKIRRVENKARSIVVLETE